MTRLLFPFSDVFKFDDQYQENEDKYKELKSGMYLMYNFLTCILLGGGGGGGLSRKMTWGMLKYIFLF